VQGVDGGGVLVTSSAGERVDGDQRVAAESGAWSSSSISSSSEGRERLEAVRASVARVVDVSVDVLQVWVNRRRQDVHQRERNRGVPKRNGQITWLRRNPGDNGRRCSGLRREISAFWRLLGLGEKR
jgi:hypothetical protein